MVTTNNLPRCVAVITIINYQILWLSHLIDYWLFDNETWDTKVNGIQTSQEFSFCSRIQPKVPKFKISLSGKED